ncbi:cytochrome P450 315a1, mitochondrial-like [Choristoneura fumiferana]|uniref:cytochrome P450 315a1, mitochondrial-like n=1 Tax=Choristoneura fumiferana TaxID=7141 RepID=UPI003D15C884
MYTLIKKTFHRVGKKLFVRNCVTSQGQTKYIKTIEDMAHPKSLPLLGTKLDLIFAGGGTKLHEYIDKRHKQLGPIFYEKLEGDTKLVFVSDPMLIKSVFLSLEGKYPAHILPEPWVLYEKFYGSKRGLFFMNGEEWLTNRRIMNKLLLREDSIKWIEEPVKNTVEKFVQYWKTEVKDGTVANLESDLYRLSTEVILSILIGTNSSLKYSAHYEELLTMLSETVKKIFQTTTKLFGLPLNLCLRLNLNVWRNFKESVDMSLLLAQKLVSEMLLKRDDNNGLVHKLLAENVSDNLIIRIVADFIIAAGDTTAYTSIWSLFLLAQNDEISHEIRTGNIGYVKNVVKESMRLYPVAPFLTRILPKNDILGDFQLPENTPIIASIYTSGRDEQYFSKAHKFLPYRWDRNDPRRKDLVNHVTSASVPFALGARSCIGRKMAMLQLTEFITQIVHNFDLKCGNVAKVSPVTSQVLVPSCPVELIISQRNK